MKSKLFSPIQFREIILKNRIVVSPMCTYSAHEGVPNNWHLVHLGTRATGGAGLVMVEATGVVPEGRITSGCLGLWNDKQAEAFKPIVDYIHSQNSIAAIQLAHAGRKASTAVPLKGGSPLINEPDAWKTVDPSEIAFNSSFPKPRALAVNEIHQLVESFCQSAVRAHRAGFDMIELHMAHGYLLHQFLSPLSNLREDQYGGSLENRMRFPLEVAQSVRKVWPQEKPLFVRISATDAMSGGWNIQEAVTFCSELKKIGIDLIDVSSGGLHPDAKMEIKPLYQVPFASKIKLEAQIFTGTVGLITQPKEAESILQNKDADLVFLARELLRNPYWPLNACAELEGLDGLKSIVPHPYQRAFKSS